MKGIVNLRKEKGGFLDEISQKNDQYFLNNSYGGVIRCL